MRDYDAEILKAYKKYRREFRNKFPHSKQYMCFDEFEFEWNWEFSGDDNYAKHVKAESSQWVRI